MKKYILYISTSYTAKAQDMQNMQKTMYIASPSKRSNVSPVQASNVVLHHTSMHYNSPVLSLSLHSLSFPFLSRHHMRVSACASLMMMPLLS